MDKKILLTGNANVGKTSLFNNLTKSSEHIGNWHGVTVESKTKTITYKEKVIEFTDLPGICSLSVYSFEENVSRDNIIGANDSFILNVAEVNNLPRNLYLTLQLMELGKPFILIINMIDELKGQDKTINYGLISKYLGTEVIPVSSRYRNDTKKILDACAKRCDDTVTNNMYRPHRPDYLNQLPLDSVYNIVKDYKGFNKEWCAIKLLEGDTYIGEYLELTAEQNTKIAALGCNDKVAALRYAFIEELVKKAIIYKDPKKSKKAHGQSAFDKIILNKFLALPIFFLFMALTFLFTFGSVGKIPMPGKFLSDMLERLIKLIFNPLINLLIKQNATPWVTALVRDGIVSGVGGVLVFLPQVALLFMVLAFMEDTGYLSRVAFMTDGLFRKIGLSGKASFTLLMGFGCSATAVLTSRNLEEENVRKKTVMITPFMSCGARLPVYAVIGGAFFGGANAILIFALYVLGVAVAMFWAFVMEKFTKLKSSEPDYIMEMPPYRMPTGKRVCQILWNNIRIFSIRVGTVIFSLNIIVWLLSSFSFSFVYVLDTGGDSMMKIIAGFIAPIFKPLGFGDWKAVTALISGLIAKESVVSVLDSMGAISGEGAIFGGALPALSFLIFTLLYIPCFAAISAINKEIGKKYMFFTLCIEFFTAYTVSFAVYNIGLLFYSRGAMFVCMLLLLIMGSLTVVITLIRLIIAHKKKVGAKQYP